MRKIIIFVFSLLLIGVACHVQAQSPFFNFPPGAFSTKAANDPAAGGGGGGCTASANFLARTSLAGADITNYQNLICGLVTDGIITGNLSGATGCGTKLDGLYILATVNTTEALKNLCGTSFSLTVTGTPTFTAYQGYAGIDDGSTTRFLDTNYNMSSSGGVFATNSCHIMRWNNADVQGSATGGANIGAGTSGSNATQINAWYADTNGYFGCNNGNFLSVSVANGTSIGMYTASRTGASVFNTIRNSSTSVYTGTDVAGTLQNTNLLILGVGAANGNSSSVSVSSFGAGLSGGDITLLFNRLATYRTAVGL